MRLKMHGDISICLLCRSAISMHPLKSTGQRLGHNLHECCLLCTSMLCTLSPYASLQSQHFKLITVFCMILCLRNLLASEVSNIITLLHINLCWAGSHLSLFSADSHQQFLQSSVHQMAAFPHPLPRDFMELGKSAFPYFAPWSCNNLQNTKQLTDVICLREFEMLKRIYLK